MDGSIEVVEHDPSWAQRFVELRGRYLDALAQVPVVSIEHVGSTAVPGLAAKPVIDIDIVVVRQHVDDAIAAMERIGFESRGELGIPDRWALAAPSGFPRTNTYVVVDGSLSLRNHLGVREVLQRDGVLRDEYSAVKRSLAATCTDIDDYVVGKSTILGRVLAAAGWTPGELAELAEINRRATGHP